MTTRILFLAVLAGAPCAGQIVAFPTSYDNYFSMAPSQWSTLVPSLYSTCHPRVQAGPRYVTPRISVGDYTFRAVTGDGVIAVFKKTNGKRLPHAGIDTGMKHVLHIDLVRATSWLPQGHIAMLITAYDNEQTRFKLFYLDPSLALTSGVLFDAPSTVSSQGNEVLVSASMIGTSLYALDGVALKVVKFVDTNADLVPDQRDGGFDLTLPYPHPSASFVERFMPHVSFDAVMETGGVRTRKLWAIDTSQGAAKFIVADRVTTPITPGPIFVALPSGGHDRVLVSSASGGQVVVEQSSSSTGPWSTVSGVIATVNQGEPYLGTLTSALVVGTYARLRDLQTAQSSAPVIIGDAAPIVLTPRWASTQGGSSLVVQGDNLAGSLAATFKPFGPTTAVSLGVTNQSKHSVTLALPTVTSVTSGYVELKETTGGKRSTLLLVITP